MSSTIGEQRRTNAALLERFTGSSFRFEHVDAERLFLELAGKLGERVGRVQVQRESEIFETYATLIQQPPVR